MSTASPATDSRPPSPPGGASRARIESIDALRGLVMFTMIFVNDIAGASHQVVPAWMRHYTGRSGMTFVDLVFPAFLFVVGMSIPFGLGTRLEKGEPAWRVMLHVLVRTLSLLFLGILMVNGSPDPAKTGWPGAGWTTLMYSCAILAFCSLAQPGRAWRIGSAVLRGLGLAGLVWLAFVYRGPEGERIVRLSPFAIRTQWYGILGLIGWAYLVGSVVFLGFRGRRTALLGCLVLLLCVYPADQAGAFRDWWLGRYVGIGGMLGAHPAIAVAGLLLASMLRAPDLATRPSRLRFTLAFIGGCGAAAWLLEGLYGINKNRATPSWCLWACAITAAVWLLLYGLTETRPLARLAKPLSLAGQNALLAYLLSDLWPSALGWLGLGDWYAGLATPHLFQAVARSAGCGVVLLALTVGLNRAGFRLRL